MASIVIAQNLGAGVASFPLTQKQQAVFDFIQRYLLEHHRSPFIREIQLGCQIASYKSALDRLNALEHKGFIRRAPNKHRGIKLARRAEALVSNRALPRADDVPPEADAAAVPDRPVPHSV